MIKNVIFDVGNVLASFRPKQVLLDDMGLEAEEAEAILKATVHGPLWQEMDRGVIPEKEVISQMRNRLEEKYHPNFDRFFNEKAGNLVETFSYASDWLRELKERGYGVYILSNYPVELFEMHSRHFTFLPYADGRIVSGYVKCIKPDRKIYEILLETYGLQPQECVFLDDLKENIAGANACGIHGIQFTSYEETKSRLEQLLGCEERKSRLE